MTNAQLAPYDSPIKKNSDHYKKVIAVKCMPDKALSGTPGTTRTYDLRIRSPKDTFYLHFSPRLLIITSGLPIAIIFTI